MDLEVFEEYKNKIDRLSRTQFTSDDFKSWLYCQCIFDRRLYDDDLFYALLDYIREVA